MRLICPPFRMKLELSKPERKSSRDATASCDPIYWSADIADGV